MPLLSLTMRAAELAGGRVDIKLDRDYKFTELKLLHVYHNIDSINLADSNDKTQEALLFIRLGGLIENHKQLINYEGNFEAHQQLNIPHRYDNDDFQFGNGTKRTDNPTPSTASASNRFVADVNEFFLIPIGASRFNGHNIVSRDVFKTLHKDGSVLHFNGQLKFEIHYLSHAGGLLPIDATNGGIFQAAKGKNAHNTFITLMFEYQE